MKTEHSKVPDVEGFESIGLIQYLNRYECNCSVNLSGDVIDITASDVEVLLLNILDIDKYCSDRGLRAREIHVLNSLTGAVFKWVIGSFVGFPLPTCH